MEPFPDFFQESTPDARRLQVAWLESHLNLDDGFFSRVLSVDAKTFRTWRHSGGRLEPSQELRLDELWKMFLQVLSATNYDDALARRFLMEVAKPSTASGVSGLPWSNNSLRGFLESKSPFAIQNVSSWLMSLRFAN